MRKNHKLFSILIIGAISCSALSSLAILLCIIISVAPNAKQSVQYMIPGVFWIGMLGEQSCIWIANVMRRREGENIQGLPGILCIRKTKPGDYVDIVFIVSLVLFAICWIVGIGEIVIQYILIFIMVLSFRLHCIMNGKNFRYELSKKKEQKDHAKKSKK